MKRPFILFLSLSLLAVTGIQAQVGFMRLYGDTGSIQQSSSLFPTADKGMIVCGNSEAYGTGNTDVMLVKCDSLGRIQWAKTYGGPQQEFGVAVRPSPQGGYFFLADAYGFGTDSTSDDYLVGKVDLQGNLQWAVTLGGADLETPTFMELMADGSILVGGDTRSVSGGSILAYVAKLDGTGNVVWQKGCAMSGNFAQKFNCALTLLSGDILLGGSTSQNLMSDYYFVRLNTLGDTLMSRAYGYTDRPEFVRDMVPGPNGQVFLMGLESVNTESNNVSVLRINANADTVSHVMLGSFYQELGLCMDQLYDGSLLIAGYVDTDTTLSITSPRAVFYKIAAGNIPSAKWVGPPGFSRINDVRGLPAGGYMACGEAAGAEHPDDVDFLITRTSPQEQIGCTEEVYSVSLSAIPVGGMQKGGTFTDPGFSSNLVSLTQTDFTGRSTVTCGTPDPQAIEALTKKNTLHVYPNPCNDVLFLENEKAKNPRMYDCTGKQVGNFTYAEGYPGILHTQLLSKGIYLLETETGRITFIKQ